MDESKSQGLSDETVKKLGSAGEFVFGAAISTVGTTVAGPAGTLASHAIKKGVNAAPVEAKVMGGLGTGLGAMSALECVVLTGGGVALAPLVGVMALGGVIVGGAAFGLTWLAKSLFD